MIIDGLEGPVGTYVLEAPGYVCHIGRNLERGDLIRVLRFDVAIVTAIVSSLLATYIQCIAYEFCQVPSQHAMIRFFVGGLIVGMIDINC